MRVQHNLGILETLILGQGILCAALMIQTMKGKEHIVLRYETNGSAKGFSVEVDSTGYVRGFLLNNPIPVDNSKPKMNSINEINNVDPNVFKIKSNTVVNNSIFSPFFLIYFLI